MMHGISLFRDGVLSVCFLTALFSIDPVRGQSLPAAYDLRSVSVMSGTVAWVPAVQNQGAASDCWTFAAATAINSNLQKNGWLATSEVAPAIQVSSWHLSTRNGAADQLKAEDALGNNSNWGAESMGQALGYLTRGQGVWTIPNVPIDPNTNLPSVHYVNQMGGGVVLDTAPVSPSNAFPASISQSSGYPNNLTSLIPSADQPSAFRVTKVAMYDQGFGRNVALPAVSGSASIGGTTYNTYTFNQGASDPQVGVVKQAINDHGAVTTWMNADNSGFSTVANPPGSAVQNTINYVNNRTAVGFSDHSVTIIGWNDTYQITRGDTTYTGAWLVQNSWGTSGWDEGDGTFWAPYDDAVIGRSGVSGYEATPQNGVSVLQNELGPMEYSENYIRASGNNPTGATNPLLMAPASANQVASVMTPEAEGWLTGIGLATQLAKVKVTVSLFESWTTGPTGPLYSEDFILNEMGYHEFDLASQLALTAGDDLVFQLIYSDLTTGHPIADAVPVTVGGSGLNGYLDVPAGLSLYWDESTLSWVDFSTVTYQGYSGTANANGGILFVKGLTMVPEPSVVVMTILGGGVLLIMKVSRRKSPLALPLT